MTTKTIEIQMKIDYEDRQKYDWLLEYHIQFLNYCKVIHKTRRIYLQKPFCIRHITLTGLVVVYRVLFLFAWIERQTNNWIESCTQITYAVDDGCTQLNSCFFYFVLFLLGSSFDLSYTLDFIGMVKVALCLGFGYTHATNIQNFLVFKWRYFSMQLRFDRPCKLLCIFYGTDDTQNDTWAPLKLFCFGKLTKNQSFFDILIFVTCWEGKKNKRNSNWKIIALKI